VLLLGPVLDLEALQETLHGAAGDAVDREGVRRQVAGRTRGERRLALMSRLSLTSFPILHFSDRANHGSLWVSFNNRKEVIRCRVGS